MGKGLVTGGGPVAARLPSGATVTREPFEKSVEAGQEVQVDVAFEPKFSLENVEGPKSASLVLTGPGAASSPKWSIPVPLAGTFNGIRLGVTMTSDQREIYLVDPDASFDVTLTFVGTDVARKGTLRGQNVPAGVSLAPQPLTVPPGQTVKSVARVQFDGASFRRDGVGRPGEIVFVHDGGSSKAGSPSRACPRHSRWIPGTGRTAGSRRPGCSSEPHRRGSRSISGPGTRASSRLRRSGGEADAAGERIGRTAVSVGYAAPTAPVLETRRSDQPASSLEDYAKIVHGPVTFRCQEVMLLAPPENQPE